MMRFAREKNEALGFKINLYIVTCDIIILWQVCLWSVELSESCDKNEELLVYFASSSGTKLWFRACT